MIHAFNVSGTPRLEGRGLEKGLAQRKFLSTELL